jgi:heterodisulfide reductase subunit A
MISLTIDDQQIQVEPGTSVLQACQQLGIDIPTLCYHRALPAYGACRLCLVEVEENGRSKLQASCLYPAREGLIVRTGTDLVVRTRRIMAELLLARCPSSEKVKAVAAQLGVTQSRFPPKNEDCILCGLCVRVCAEVMKRGAIDFVGRGDRRKVRPAYDKHSPICIACGACQFICPTGAASLAKASQHEARPIWSEFDAGLRARPCIYIPFPQAVPNTPVIDRENCVHFLTGACKVCQSFCPAGAIDYGQEDQTVELSVGSVILAPGYELFDARRKLELGYGLYPNVITSLQFERILSASGPSKGELRRPSDGAHPRHVAFLQCVGSRDREHDYCSSICCMYATKEAIIAREHEAELACSIFYMDMRAFGKGFDAYFQRAQELGVRYVRCRVGQVEEVRATGNLVLHYEAEDGTRHAEEFDLVVLSVGIGPPADAAALAERFGIETDAHGFASTDPFTPVRSSREGIYVCGPFVEPKDIPETVMEASAAAACAMGLLAERRGTEIREVQYPPEKDVGASPPRVGVFVCHCGRNIGGVVDVPAVVAYAKTLPDVVHAEDNLYTCSTDTQARIRQLISEHNLNRVVVASCTPRTHEPLFRNTLRNAGLNQYLFEMANIRDQCSWVHMHQPAEATVKARDLVRMAVAKARLLEPLQKGSIAVKHDALVIGGGMSGMTAALNLADQGFLVHLVEREEELGGNLRKLRLLPDGSSVSERLAETVRRVMQHPKIKVHLGSRIQSVSGSVGNFSSVIARGESKATVEHGAVVVAVGADSAAPKKYLYGADPRVLTQLELEDKLATGQDIGKRLVMIQCVGSREEGRTYCSRVCCTQAIKNALCFKARVPGGQVFILYRDIRTYGRRERLYTQAREQGVQFIRYTPEDPPAVTADNDSLRVNVADPVLGRRLLIHADAVVLAPAIVPREGALELAQMLKIPLNADGFFLEAHMKLRPMDFATEGIYLCGLAHSPKWVDESIVQAQGAAARAATLLAKERLELEGAVSEVRDANCDGCAYCIEPCPYKALTLIEYVRGSDIKKTVETNPALCKGCGVCMATCPKEGIWVRHFKPAQIKAMVEAALAPE